MPRYPSRPTRLSTDELAQLASGRWADRPFLTVADVAELLNITEPSVYRLRHEGRFDGTFTKVAGRLRFMRERLFRKVAEQGI